MMRRIPVIAISLITAIALAGCGEKEEEVEINERPRVREEATATPEPTPTPEAVAEPEPEPDGPSVIDDPDYEALFEPVLTEVCDVIENGYDYDREYNYVPTGLIESAIYEDKDTLLETVGYIIEDISGDGVPELLLGRNEQTDSSAPGEISTVYACYTYRTNGPIMSFEGLTRSTFRWLGDGHFSYFGSSGASFSAFGECHLSSDGETVIWDDFYFTDENDDLSLSFYHNTTGVWDTKMAEKLEISDVEFWNLLSDVKYKLIRWTSLPVGTADSNTGNAAAKVTVEWADDVVSETTDYIAYEPDYTDEYTTHLLISVDKEVKDFRLLELAFKDVDDNGKAVYDMKECFSLDELTPDKPLCAGMNFPGDMPNNGFKYKDADGTEHFCVIGISGRDGSLVVTEE